MSFKRQRYNTNEASDHRMHEEHRRVDVRDNVIKELQHRVDVLERKKNHVQRAYYTMIRDTRAEATKMRIYIEKIDQEDEDSDEIVHTIKNMSADLIKLGHCPISHEPLGENTFINICGHIFDKRTLATHKPRVCPKCSHKMMCF